MECKYIKELKDINIIEEVEEKYKVKIPNTLRDIIIKYNGGRPINNIFDTKKNKEKVIKTLLSYNQSDKENIYIYNKFFNIGFIPFAVTEFGDVICINQYNNFVELYLHELDEFEYVCENIEKFFDILYEYN